MDGKNSSGRRISLLNDNTEPPHPPARLHSISPSLRSRTSSYASSSIGSPSIPQLVRSDSSDSTAMGSPSPITPEFSFDGLASGQIFSQSSFFPRDFSSVYSSMPQNAGPLPYHPASQATYFAPQQATEPSATSASATARSKKNSYPCPMAKQYNCKDFFTTSGHAARHAKKHTGKKDAFCPECNKAFTRKDNMEQHRRTHQSGRNVAKGSESCAKKPKQQSKRPKPAPLQTSPPSLSSLSVGDALLPLSPSMSNFTMAPAVQSVDGFNTAYPDPTMYSLTHGYPTGSSYGLDALAIAASGEKRKYEA